MANLVICGKCNQSWSLTFDPYDSPLLMKYCWCPTCRIQDSLVFVGNVPGVMKPPLYTGATPPPAPPASPMLMLTYHPQPPQQPSVQQAATAVAPVQVPQQPAVNVLPPGQGVIILGQTESSRDTSFCQHVQGQPITIPPKRFMDKYFTTTLDKSLSANPSYDKDTKMYVRFLAILMVEVEKRNKILINNPKGDTYKGVTAIRRDLTSTLLRIAKGESIAKTLNNAAYNNDGNLSSNKIKYDRYGKGYKGSRTGSTHLAAPSDAPGAPDKYWEFYVDRDNATGASPLSMGAGKPGVERLFIQVPDFVFYTWNHYGSDMGFGADRGSATEHDIWMVYSFQSHAWQPGITRT